MEQNVVKFSVIKDKIIKTDEVLRKYLDSTNNLKKVQIACKELKGKYEQVTQNLNRLQLENERVNFHLNTVNADNHQLQTENSQLTIENNKLKEQIKSLEDHYGKHVIETQSTIKNLEDEVQMLQELNKFDSLSTVKKDKEYNEETIEKIKQLEKASEDLQILESNYKDILNKLSACNKELQEKSELIVKDKAVIFKLNEDNSNLQKELHDFKSEIKLKKSEPSSIEYERISSDLLQKIKELETMTHENAAMSAQLVKASEDLKEAKAKMNIRKPILRDNYVQTESICNYTNHSYNEIDKMDTSELSIENIMKEIQIPRLISPFIENEVKANELSDIKTNPFASEVKSKETLTELEDSGRSLKRQKYRIPLMSKEFIKLWYNSRIIRSRKKMRGTKLPKKREQDSILTALEILKKSKINFTISNESLLGWPRCGCYSDDRPMINISSQVPLKNSSKLYTQTTLCDNCNGSSSQMILNKLSGNQLELLGFVNVKKEVTSPTSLMGYIQANENLENFRKQFENKRPITQSLNKKESSDYVCSGNGMQMNWSNQNKIYSEQENNVPVISLSDCDLVKFPSAIEDEVTLKNKLSFDTVPQSTISTSNIITKENVMQNNDLLKFSDSYNHCPNLLRHSSTTTNMISHSDSEIGATLKVDVGNNYIKLIANDMSELDIRPAITKDNPPSCPDSPDPMEIEQTEYCSPKVIPLDTKSPSPNRRSERIIGKRESCSSDVSIIYTCDRLQSKTSKEVQNPKNDCSNNKANAIQVNSVYKSIVPLKEKTVSVKHDMKPHTEDPSLLKTESLKQNQEHSTCNKKVTVKSRKPISKLKSKVLREVRARRKLYQTKSVESSEKVQVKIEADKNNFESDTEINRLKLLDAKIKPGKKITVVQNILIPPDSSCPVDLLSSKRNIVHPDRIVKDSIISGNNSGDDYSPNDVLSRIMGEMNKDKPEVITKPSRKNVTPSSIEDKEWRKTILDIADILHCNSHKVIGNPLVTKCNESTLNTTWRKECFSNKLKLLMKKLLSLTNDEQIRDDIITEFKRLKVSSIVHMILHKLSLDVSDKPDINNFPAPLMTRTQRILLALMVRLEKEKMENLIDTFLAKAEFLLFKVGCGVRVVIPVTRLYVAICRLRGDVNMLRVFYCKAFYFMGDLAIPLLFTVLTSWIEVFPKETDTIKNPATKVLVQIVHLKTCNNDGYNLLPLRCLLHQFYGYPKERWNCDEIFDQLCQEYLRNPGDDTDFALRLFCKNKDTKWVSKKLNEFFKPLVYKIPAENENFKATVIILIGNICRQFNKSKAVDEVILLDMERWLGGVLEDNPSGLVPQSIQLTLDILHKKKKKTRKTGVKNRKKNNKAATTRPNIEVAESKNDDLHF